jgi:hypothetical protein
VKIVLISPGLDEMASAEGDKHDSYNRDLADALSTFHSREWRPGWDPDRRLVEKYGDWMVYIRYPQGGLWMLGHYADLLSQHCPEHMTQWKT